MITIINEKSSQAAKFAKALGGKTGTLPSDSTLGAVPYEIHEASGHLLAFKPLDKMVPADEKSAFTQWDLNTLPFDRTQISWEKELNPNTLGRGASTYMSAFKKSLDKSDVAVIATDYDQSGEGDMIGWEIIKWCNFKGKVYRCHHASEDPGNVIKAFKNLKYVGTLNDIQDGLLRKAEARQKFDFLTIQYTRVLADLASKAKVVPANGLSRVGRLKSAMVYLIGNQERLHDTFKPSSVYQPMLVDEDGHKFKNIDKKAPFYKTEAEAQEHLSEIPQNAKSKELGVNNLTSRPPKMLNLSKVASRLAKQGYDKSTVEDLAEKMYQDDYLSYPRTDDKDVTQGQLDEMMPLVDDICDVVGVDKKLIHKDNFRSYLIGKGGAHGANRPGLKVPDSLDELKERYGATGAALYDILARSFLAGFCDDKKSERHIYADDSTEHFRASATVVVSPGWSAVLKETKPDNDTEEHKLFTTGQALKPAVWEKKATRPSLATSDSLFTFLTKNDIGTGATQLDTLNDISNKKKKTRQLVNDAKDKLRLTKLGLIAYLDMQNTGLASPKITKELEQYLNAIRDKKGTERAMLLYFDKLFLHDKACMIKNQALLNNLPKEKSNAHDKVKGIYALTGKEVSFGDAYGQGKKEHKFSKDEIKFLLNGSSITFPYGEATVTGKLADRGKPYGFGFKAEKIEYPQAPQAKGVLKETGEEVSFKREFSHHEFTQNEINKLLDGETISFEGRKKAGGKYTAKVKLVYGVPYGSKTGKKTWHVGFADTGKLKKGKYKKYKKQK